MRNHFTSRKTLLFLIFLFEALNSIDNKLSSYRIYNKCSTLIWQTRRESVPTVKEKLTNFSIWQEKNKRAFGFPSLAYKQNIEEKLVVLLVKTKNTGAMMMMLMISLCLLTSFYRMIPANSAPSPSD